VDPAARKFYLEHPLILGGTTTWLHHRLISLSEKIKGVTGKSPVTPFDIHDREDGIELPTFALRMQCQSIRGQDSRLPQPNSAVVDHRTSRI
ncbi:hypothetical protein, partial [Burkholderia gladioli]